MSDNWTPPKRDERIDAAFANFRIDDQGSSRLFRTKRDLKYWVENYGSSKIRSGFNSDDPKYRIVHRDGRADMQRRDAAAHKRRLGSEHFDSAPAPSATPSAPERADESDLDPRARMIARDAARSQQALMAPCLREDDGAAPVPAPPRHPKATRPERTDAKREYRQG